MNRNHYVEPVDRGVIYKVNDCESEEYLVVPYEKYLNLLAKRAQCGDSSKLFKGENNPGFLTKISPYAPEIRAHCQALVSMIPDPADREDADPSECIMYKLRTIKNQFFMCGCLPCRRSGTLVWAIWDANRRKPWLRYADEYDLTEDPNETEE